MRQPTSLGSLNLLERPVTNHGLGGVKGLKMGPGIFNYHLI